MSRAISAPASVSTSTTRFTDVTDRFVPATSCWRVYAFPDSSFSATFHAGGDLLLALAWLAALAIAVYVLLRRAVGTRG